MTPAQNLCNARDQISRALGLYHAINKSGLDEALESAINSLTELRKQLKEHHPKTQRNDDETCANCKYPEVDVLTAAITCAHKDGDGFINPDYFCEHWEEDDAAQPG